MAGKILALLGRVTRAEAGRVLGIDFSDWTLRKDDPRGSGRKVTGMRDRRREAFTVACASLADLERAGHLLALEGYAQQVIVYVTRTAKPERVRLALPESSSLQRTTVVTSGGSLIIRAEAEGPLIDVGAFVLSLLRPSNGLTRNIRMVVADESFVGLLGMGAKSAVGMGAFPRTRDSIPPFDIFITAAGDQEPRSEGDNRAETQCAEALCSDAPSLTPTVLTAIETLLPVNTAWTSPTGFLSSPPLGTAGLRLSRDQSGRHLVTATEGAQILGEYNVSSVVSENLVHDLRPYRRVQITGYRIAEGPVGARLVTALVGAGIPVMGIDSESHHFLPPAVRKGLAALTITDLNDNHARALWSVRTRREVLADHRQDQVRAQLAGAGGYALAAAESVSILIASARPDKVPSIIGQARTQNYPAAEIVLGMHGFTRAELIRRNPGLHAVLDRVVLLELGAELVLGEVLQRLSKAAGGELITKMDDDDFYTADHVGDLVAARGYSGAELVGAKAEFIYLEEQGKTIQRRPNSECYGRSVTGGTILLSRDALRQAGGWSPVRTAEDRLLQEGIRRAGGAIYRSHGTNYLMSRGDGARGHTWTPGTAYFEEQAVREWPGAGYPGWRTSGSDA